MSHHRGSDGALIKNSRGLCAYLGTYGRFAQRVFVGPRAHHATMARTIRLDCDALDRLLIQQLDVIARAQALAVGVTDNALRHRLRPGGPWRTLLPGVYMAASGAPTTLQQEMAALLYAGPGSVITGPAALRSHHIKVELTDTIDVLVPASRQRRDTGFVALHRTTRMPGRTWEAAVQPVAVRRRRNLRRQARRLVAGPRHRGRG